MIDNTIVQELTRNNIFCVVKDYLIICEKKFNWNYYIDVKRQ